MGALSHIKPDTFFLTRHSATLSLSLRLSFFFHFELAFGDQPQHQYNALQYGNFPSFIDNFTHYKDLSHSFSLCFHSLVTSRVDISSVDVEVLCALLVSVPFGYLRDAAFGSMSWSAWTRIRMDLCSEYEEYIFVLCQMSLLKKKGCQVVLASFASSSCVAYSYRGHLAP